MRPPPGLLLLLCLALSPLEAGAFVVHLEVDCPLSASGRAPWANYTLAFNKVPFVCYDNGFQGFLPCGLGASFPWNYTSVPICQYLNSRAPKPGQLVEACQQQIQPLWGRTGDRRTPPKVRILPVTPQNTPFPIMLACVAWGFYPSEVDITWLWNGQAVTHGVGPLVVSSNGDWTYQARRTLPVDPQRGGTYTCRVTHASLPGQLTTDWVPGLSVEKRLKAGVSSAVLALGILVFAIGVTCFRKRVSGGYLPLDGSNYPEGR
ncbi:class II histocompatibility antigen, M beta 1 chain isoform X2 [Elgaria multicarinata webbii]|uniref:class II histocompatibility antigen, M beta 1 chain isoform X2 n=1 Tax=Elgaria multicarinata webbii TaxID=159646 RepID=UPI002FCCC8C2